MENRIRKFDDNTSSVKAGPSSCGIWGNADGSLEYSSIVSGTQQVFQIPAALGVSGAAAGAPVQVKELTFTETSGAGTYTGTVVVPAGGTIHDIIVNGVALWNASGACTLKIGDTDDDGYYTAVDLKATDLLAGESLSFALAGGKAGAYIANSQVSPRYSATAHTINAIVSAAGTAGSTGRTRVSVVYSVPAAAAITAATKV